MEKVPEGSMVSPKPVIAVESIGLTPISPVTAVAPVVVIPDLDRIA